MSEAPLSTEERLKQLIDQLRDAQQDDYHFTVSGEERALLLATLEAHSSPGGMTRVYEVFGIGANVRDPAVLLVNVLNAKRRSDCLDAIERQFFTSFAEDDEGNTGDQCDLSWGAEPDEYVKQFKIALDARFKAEGRS